MILSNDGNKNGNILFCSLQNYYPKATNSLWEWVEKKYGEKTLKKLIRNGRESSLFAAIRYKSGHDKVMLEKILNFMKGCLKKEELRDFVLERDEDGQNIFYCSLEKNDYRKTAWCLWEWLQNNLGNVTVQKLIEKGKVNDNGETIESSLFTAVRHRQGKKRKFAKLILNFMKDRLLTKEELCNFVLAYSKDKGGNILYYALKNDESNTTQYLWEWIKQFLGVASLKELIEKGRKDESGKIESSLFAAVRYKRGKSDEMTRLVLNFMKDESNIDCLRNFILAKNIKLDQNVSYFSEEFNNEKAVLYLIKWVINHLGVEAFDVLKELISGNNNDKKLLGNSNDKIKKLFENLKKQSYEICELNENIGVCNECKLLCSQQSTYDVLRARE